MSIGRSVGVMFATAALLLGGTTAAQAAKPGSDDGGATIQHDIVCTMTIGRPYKVSGTSVRTDGTVRCNYSPDAANTTVQLQILEGSSWRNYGNPYTTSSTGVNLYPYDSAGMLTGCNYYRGRLHREAFHGNWGSNTIYSSSAYLCR